MLLEVDEKKVVGYRGDVMVLWEVRRATTLLLSSINENDSMYLCEDKRLDCFDWRRLEVAVLLSLHSSAYCS